MDLLKIQVMHKVFGRGMIVAADDQFIMVRFAEKFGEKRFVYPDAFVEFLSIEDPKNKAVIIRDVEARLKWIKSKHALAEERK